MADTTLPTAPDVAVVPEPIEPLAAPGRRLVLARMRDFALVPAVVVIAVIGELVNPVFLDFQNTQHSHCVLSFHRLAKAITCIHEGPVAHIP